MPRQLSRDGEGAQKHAVGPSEPRRLSRGRHAEEVHRPLADQLGLRQPVALRFRGEANRCEQGLARGAAAFGGDCAAEVRRPRVGGAPPPRAAQPPPPPPPPPGGVRGRDDLAAVST
jgi:hypothetical protein